MKKVFMLKCTNCENETKLEWKEYRESRILVIGEQWYDTVKIRFSCECGNEFELGSDA